MASSNPVVSNDYRTQVTNYWKLYSPTVESMMFTSEASLIKDGEEREILSCLPDFKGQKILEIAAGIGRFTGTLASSASHVTAVDFMQDYLEENKRKNGLHDNITYECADIIMTDYPPQSFDFVFSNWILMYVNDEEMEALYAKVLRWLKPGGHFFFRESFYGAIGNLNKEANPSQYRTPSQTCQPLLSMTSPDGACFRIVRGRNLLKYIQHYGNPTQLCFLVKKINRADSPSDVMSSNCTVLASLRDVTASQKNQLCLDDVLREERIDKDRWYCLGGYETNKDLCAKHLALQPSHKILDLGCGTGASSFFTAGVYGCQVHGITLSVWMLHLAVDMHRTQERKVREKVQFEFTNDLLSTDFDEATYDVIYSRDNICNIPNKNLFFKKLHKCLKPGGTLFFTDFCKGPGPYGKEFEGYAKDRKGLSMILQYVEALGNADFIEIQATEQRSQATELLQKDLDFLMSSRNRSADGLPKNSDVNLVKTMNDEIKWTRDGHLTWVIFKARKGH